MVILRALLFIYGIPALLLIVAVVWLSLLKTLTGL